ncbi:MAG TPA: hypothetical protein GXX75_20130 [Clostridiales bacterium]|nr:hypothetical protein [Clostridiales bacterium]
MERGIWKKKRGEAGRNTRREIKVCNFDRTFAERPADGRTAAKYKGFGASGKLV